MPLASKVKLQNDVEPVFPNRCVCEGEEDPEECLDLRPGQASLMKFFVASSWHRLPAMRVPMCTMCAYDQRTWFRNLIIVPIVVAGFIVTLIVLTVLIWPGVPEWFGALITIAVGLLAYCCQGFFPPPFRAARYTFAKATSYYFRYADYAAEFARLNEPHVVSTKIR